MLSISKQASLNHAPILMTQQVRTRVGAVKNWDSSSSSKSPNVAKMTRSHYSLTR